MGTSNWFAINVIEKQDVTTKSSRYYRDIGCFPNDCCSSHVVRIPRSREALYEEGLVGRIRLTSEMSQDDIFTEIRSVFKGPMGNNDEFDVLQSTGGGSKSLVVPALSSSYQWTASALAPKTPIYILAKEPLKLPNDVHPTKCLSESDDDLPPVDFTKHKPLRGVRPRDGDGGGDLPVIDLTKPRGKSEQSSGTSSRRIFHC